MFCQKCGHQIKDEAAFCEKCGTNINNTEIQLEYAGFWRRFLALFIDNLVIAIPACILMFLVFFMMIAMTGNSNILDASTINLYAYGVTYLTAWLYYAFFESSTYQATPGKMLSGIIVTDLKGKRLDFGKATGRYFGKFLSMFILFIGFLMVPFTSKKQGLHDMLAKCLVVKKHSS